MPHSADLDVIRSATSVGARLVGEEGRLGVVAPGALADLIAVAGNPLEDIDLLIREGGPVLVMRAGHPVAVPGRWQ